MADIRDFYNAKNIVALWEQLKGTNYVKPLAKWFPYMSTNDIDVTMAVGYERQNVSLDLCAYDTNSRIRGLQPISTHKHEIPMFKNSVIFSEKDRREVLRSVKLANSDVAIATALSSHMQNVVDILLNGADVIGERYRSQLLQHGAITVSSPASHVSPSSVSINYDVKGQWRKNNLKKWTTKPSEISGTGGLLNDISDLFQSYIKKNGQTPCTMIMNGTTFINLCQDEDVQEAIVKSSYALSAQDIVSRVMGIPTTFLIDNETFRPDVDENEVSYWENDVISVVPNRPLGHVLCGLTPTQYDELYSETKRDVQSSSENFCIQCRHRDDPIQTEAIGSVCMLPQFDEMDKCFVIRG